MGVGIAVKNRNPKYYVRTLIISSLIPLLTTSCNKEDGELSEAIQACEQAAVQASRYPSKASHIRTTAYKVEKHPNSPWLTTGFVIMGTGEFMNGFGLMIPASWVCTKKPNGTAQVVLSN